MKSTCRTIAAAWVLVGLACSSFAGQVRLEIRDGLVTLDARDATVREILAEWARVGQTRVINAERAPGGPMTLQLSNVPERQALDTVLRSVAGFVAAPRILAAGVVAPSSVFERIVLMAGARPTVVATTAGAAGVSPAANQSQYQPPRYVPPSPNVAVDDQDEPLPAGQMPLPGQPAGASQPGMMTPGRQPYQPGGQPYGGQPYGTPPYGGAGMTPNQPVPNQQGNPASSPYGTPYGNPYNPNAPGGGAAQPGQPTMPQSAPTPGMPTAPAPPVKPPDPIKK